MADLKVSWLAELWAVPMDDWRVDQSVMLQVVRKVVLLVRWLVDNLVACLVGYLAVMSVQ
jgi:hypothetical protein